MRKKSVIQNFLNKENQKNREYGAPPYISQKNKIQWEINDIKARLNSEWGKQDGSLEVSKPYIIDVDGLSINYETSKGTVRAVKDISFKVEKGTITSLVGETGSGKSSTALAIIGMLPHASGHVRLHSYIIPASSRFITKKFRQYLAKTMQFIFQDPYTSMSPKSRVESILKEPLLVNNPYSLVRNKKKAEMFHAVNMVLIKIAEKISEKNLDYLQALAEKINHERETVVEDLLEKFEIDEYEYKNAKAYIWQIKNTFKTRLQTFVDKKHFEQRKHLDNENYLVKLIDQHNKEYIDFKTDLERRRDEELLALKEAKVVQKRKLAEDKKTIASMLRQIKKDKRKLDRELTKIYRKYKNKNGFDSSIFDHYYNYYIYKDLEGAPAFKRMLKKTEDFLSGGIIDLLEYKSIVRRINNIVKCDEKYAEQIATIVNSYFVKYSRTAAKHYTLKLIQDRLVQMGLNADDIIRYPKDFSGGQRQRIAIARAMMADPEILIADEPISSLDVSIQAQIINLIKDLKEENDLTVLFIAHDLRMVEFISDNIVVMCKGQILEKGAAKEIFENPTHPYTRSLLSAIPSIDSINQELDVLDYDIDKYQNPNEDLKEFPLSETHTVLSTNEWIEDWKKEASQFVVYKHSRKRMVKE